MAAAPYIMFDVPAGTHVLRVAHFEFGQYVGVMFRGAQCPTPRQNISGCIVSAYYDEPPHKPGCKPGMTP